MVPAPSSIDRSTTARPRLWVACVWMLVLVMVLGAAGWALWIRTPPPAASAAGGDSKAAGYRLLMNLADSLSDVSDVFVLRDAEPRTRKLVDATAALAAEIRRDVGPHRGARNPLPEIERRVRSNLARRTAWRLLNPTTPFDRALLLSQLDATRYGAALCEELHQLERDPSMRDKLARWRQRFESLHEQMFTALITP